jgi:hypothetical protein
MQTGDVQLLRGFFPIWMATIQEGWLYSWMIPHCKTEEKYKVSKVLLSAYLHHSDFLDITSEAVADQIGTFIRARAKGCINGGFSVPFLTPSLPL